MVLETKGEYLERKKYFYSELTTEGSFLLKKLKIQGNERLREFSPFVESYDFPKCQKNKKNSAEKKFQVEEKKFYSSFSEA